MFREKAILGNTQSDSANGMVNGEGADPLKRLATGYIMALTVIAFVALCACLLSINAIREPHRNGIVLLKQNAQIQRIAFLASRYVDSPGAGNKAQLRKAFDQMRHYQDAIIHGNEHENTTPLRGEALRTVYYEDPHQLAREMEEFMARAESLLATSAPGPASKDYLYIIRNQEHLVKGLNAAVAAFEAGEHERMRLLQYYQLGAFLVILATLLAEALLVFRPLVRHVSDYTGQFERMALTDALTGIDNKRSFLQKGKKELHSSIRHGKSLSVCMLDIDHFKNVNDTYGHPVGDQVLKAFVDIVLRVKRGEDEFARVGGEEFALLLPHTNGRQALVLAERLRSAVEVTPVKIPGQADIFLTVSIGVAEVNPVASNVEQAMNEADRALYRAKEKGRNRIEYAGAPRGHDKKAGMIA